MYPSAVTHLVATTIDEQRYRDAELARQARAARDDDPHVQRRLVALAKAIPAVMLARWLPTIR
jgi:hypothetical protein